MTIQEIAEGLQIGNRKLHAWKISNECMTNVQSNGSTPLTPLTK